MIRPGASRDSVDLADPEVMRTFMASLLRLTEAAEARLQATFDVRGGGSVGSYVQWGVEMNYLAPTPAGAALGRFLADPDARAAFVLSSVFSLVNRAFLGRTLASADGLARDVFSWASASLPGDLLARFAQLFDDVCVRNLDQDILGDIYERTLARERPDGAPSYRQLLGQYYTPAPIMRLMWALTRQVLRTTRGRDLVEPSAPMLQILDPCSGSGGFLCEAVLQAAAAGTGTMIDRLGRVPGLLGDRCGELAGALHGFELNPLSKSLADVNLSVALMRARGPAEPGAAPVDRLNLFRTDSLDLGGQGSAAVLAAKDRRYDVVIGNPPYAGSGRADALNEELIPFAMPAYNFDAAGAEVGFDASVPRRRGSIPRSESNRGKLRDQYSYFFGVADRLLVDGGVLTYITSNTWLAIPTYTWFRRYFLTRFTLHFLINFNNIGDRGSLFAPDTGVATALVVMTRGAPPPGHRTKVLDLSGSPSTRARFDAFADITWRRGGVDRRDILDFTLKPLSQMGFVEIEQSRFLDRPDYRMRVTPLDPLVDLIERNSVRLSEHLSSFQGVDAGDVKNLVADSRAALRDNIVHGVFAGALGGFGRTAAAHIRAGLEAGRIERVWDEAKAVPFVFQKDMERWTQPPTSWIYMDHHVLWRSRLRRRGEPAGEIFATHKLFVLERRERSRLVALVTDRVMAPQHGGRFFYFVARDGRTDEDLHTVCALLNSRLVNVYYRVASQGNKDVRIRPLESIPHGIRARLAALSKARHALGSERIHAEGERIQHLIDDLVEDLYELTTAERRTVAEHVG